MGRVYYGLPKKIALVARDKYNLKYFVDTGAGTGVDVSWAAMRFDNVYAIEMNDTYFAGLESKTEQFVNIVKFHAPTVQAIKDILFTLDAPALFWINDHEPGKPCLVLEEIEEINKSKYEHVIMVDDASLFGNYDWPSQAKVMMMLRDHNRRVAYIEDDVIVSRPK